MDGTQGLLASTVSKYDVSGNFTKVTENFSNGNSIAFDAGTYSGLSLDASTNTLSATLMANGMPVGTLNLKASGGCTVTLYTGISILIYTTTETFNIVGTGDVTLTAPASGTPMPQILANYLTELGDPLTTAQLDQANESFLSSAQPRPRQP